MGNQNVNILRDSVPGLFHLVLRNLIGCSVVKWYAYFKIDNYLSTNYRKTLSLLFIVLHAKQKYSAALASTTAFIWSFMDGHGRNRATFDLDP
jgi:membrane-bound acyltransferase YfiQ involved in biofilm formation